MRCADASGCSRHSRHPHACAAQVLLAAAASDDVEVAQAACCLPAKRTPASVAFAVQLLGTLLKHPHSSVRVSRLRQVTFSCRAMYNYGTTACLEGISFLHT